MRKNILWLVLVVAAVGIGAALLRPHPTAAPEPAKKEAVEPIVSLVWSCRFASGPEEWRDYRIIENGSTPQYEARIKTRAAPPQRANLPAEDRVFTASGQLSAEEWQELRVNLQGVWELPDSGRRGPGETEFELQVSSAHHQHETRFYGGVNRGLVELMDQGPAGRARQQLLAQIAAARRNSGNPQNFPR